jgi:DNA excision repair protein ERCC-5
MEVDISKYLILNSFVLMQMAFTCMQTQLRMEAFYSFKERFAKIRSKRIEKAIKGITGKSFPDTDEPEQDNPSTSKTTKKKDAGSPSRGSSRGKGTSSEIRDVESPEDTETGDPNSIADMVELTKDSNSTNKSKKGRPSGCSKGRVRSRKNAGHGATRSQVDSDTKCSSSASDEDLHTHAGNYKLEGIALRRVNNLISKKFFLITNKVTLILFYFFLLYGTHLILLSEISTLELCTRNL